MDPRTLLRDIAASPRPTGSAHNAAARGLCTRILRDLGYVVAEQPFEFSAFPGRFATPLIGVTVMALVAVAGHWGARGAVYFPLAVLVAGGVTVALAARWLARHGTTRMRLMRQRGVNLQAARPGATPGVWLCAHVDTKSQPVSTLIRTIGVTLMMVGVLWTSVLAVLAALGVPAAFNVWVAAAVVTLVGAIPVGLSVVGGASPGAFDNASGVVTVLRAASALSGASDVGILITDAEELGLAGARAWCLGGGTGVVLNCDGVDDAGEIVVMHSGAPPAAIPDAVASASANTGTAHRMRRLPLGVLTDSIAFADAGLPSVTFSRGGWGSLARVHSRRDSLANLTGEGIEATARLMAATARRLAGNPAASTLR